LRSNKIDRLREGIAHGDKKRLDMVTSLKEQPLKKAPVYRNLHVSQLASYRLPPAGWVSILHRISGALMFLLLPFVIWMFDTSLSSEVSFDEFRSAFVSGVGLAPGWFVKLVAFALIWAYLLHFCAGLRHLWMDATHAVGLEFGRLSAWVVIGLSSLLTLVLGAKLFSLF
jgi:succinate dehydrogenase / fumarate reductase cytochrome b subunit